MRSSELLDRIVLAADVVAHDDRRDAAVVLLVIEDRAARRANLLHVDVLAAAELVGLGRLEADEGRRAGCAADPAQLKLARALQRGIGIYSLP